MFEQLIVWNLSSTSNDDDNEIPKLQIWRNECPLGKYFGVLGLFQPARGQNTTNPDFLRVVVAGHHLRHARVIFGSDFRRRRSRSARFRGDGRRWHDGQACQSKRRSFSGVSTFSSKKTRSFYFWDRIKNQGVDHPFGKWISLVRWSAWTFEVTRQ